jgi:CRISPR-associated protein Csb2
VFALRVTYLTGRVYSAIFEDGDEKLEPEWPPHPSRLFSSLVAAWGEGGGEKELRPALEWLEEQPAPTIYAGSHSMRKLVQAFVPVNDSKTVPEDRPRKARTFPSASLSNPDVYFVWESEPSAELAAGLDRILKRTSALGHSSSLVAVEIANQLPVAGLTVWHPQAAEGARMRIAYPGRLRDLEERYKRFQQGAAKTNRPSAGKTVRYATLTEQRRVAEQGIFGQMIVLRRDEGPRGSLRSTLTVLAALRGAIQKLAPDPVPEYLSGHAPESTPENPVPSERAAHCFRAAAVHRLAARYRRRTGPSRSYSKNAQCSGTGRVLESCGGHPRTAHALGPLDRFPGGRRGAAPLIRG